jgi:hypothetical protein
MKTCAADVLIMLLSAWLQGISPRQVKDDAHKPVSATQAGEMLITELLSDVHG